MTENNLDTLNQIPSRKEGKIRSYQNGEIILDNHDFEALVDVFRTLLEWSNDLERAKKKQPEVPIT